MVFQTYAYTNQGGRTNNEDYCTYSDGIWVLADGLGGHDCGEVASKAASEATVRSWNERNKSMSDDSLIGIIGDVNSRVIELQKNDSLSMKTTLVFAVSDGKEIRYAMLATADSIISRTEKLFVSQRIIRFRLPLLKWVISSMKISDLMMTEISFSR